MPAAVHSRFLNLRALAALERMRFSTQQRIEGTFSGRHSSRQLGGAGEFVDYREYSQGEDLRRLDWKVLARSGKSYVRLYQDETNLVCTIAIDASGSMRFGSRSQNDSTGSKLEYAQYLAAALSYIICRSQDQVGLAVLSGGLKEWVHPGSTAGHVARLQEVIECLRTEPATRMAAGLRSLFEHSNQRGVLLMTSDFLMEDLDEVFAALRLFRHRQWEVIVLHLIHPQEERLQQGAAFRFQGLEDDGYLDCSPAEVRALYEQRFKNHMEAVRTFSLSNGCGYRRVSTAVPYLTTLGSFLVERSGS